MHLLARSQFDAENVGAEPRKGRFGERGRGRVGLGKHAIISIEGKNIDILSLYR
jgi:hypothetical protein